MLGGNFLYKDMLNHIGFIMDGNRTWARENVLPQLEGHRRGYENAKKIIELCKNRNIPYASFWALSDDNIRNRTEEEVTYLFQLLTRMMPDMTKLAKKENIRVQIVGDRSLLPRSCQEAIEKAEAETRDGSIMTVILAIGYGGQEEIARAVRELAISGKDLTKVEVSDIQLALETGEYPPPDLIIRTGNHMRHSGYFLFQSPYAEYFFSPKNWPDFDEDELDGAIQCFSQSNRKFGK